MTEILTTDDRAVPAFPPVALPTVDGLAMALFS